jgi:hypothetical protein
VETAMAVQGAIRHLEAEANRPVTATVCRIPQLTEVERLHRRQRMRATKTKGTATTRTRTTATTQAAAKAREGIAE